MGNLEFFEIDVMQEHVDSAQIVGGQINLLPEKSLANLVTAENLGEFQKQRTRTARWIINLIHFVLARQSNLGK